MKIAVLIARILLGLIFFVFGANDIVPFLKMPPMDPSPAASFAGLLVTSHYMTFVGLLMVIAGLLLLVGRFVPLALVILGPILVNILLFHTLLDPHGLKGGIPGLVAIALEIFLIAVYRKSFYTLFHPAPEVL